MAEPFRLRELTCEAIDDLCVGAAILGTGGGGDPYLGGLLAKRALREHGPVRVLRIEELEDDDFVVCSGNMGAPTVYIEKLIGAGQPVHALRALEAHIGRRFTAVMAFEAGGSNSAIPVWVAAETGLPLVDADGQGRAFPEIQMVSFGACGVSASPMAMADERGNTVILNVMDNRRSEQIARAVAVQMGARASFAAYPMTKAELERGAIAGTTSLATRLGHAVRRTGATGGDVFAAILDAFRHTHYGAARILFRGKIADVERTTRDGWAIGSVVINAIGTEDRLRIEFQNENLVATRGDRIEAIVPDLICILDSDQGLPITTERVRFGLRVTVIGIGAPAPLRTPEALSLFGPRAFRLPYDYTPLDR